MSEITTNLRIVGEEFEKNGYPVSAAIIIQAADRMVAMEELIVKLKDHVDHEQDTQDIS